MSQESSRSGRVYRVGPSLQIVLGVFLTVFAGFGVTIGLKNGDWTFLAVIVGLASAVFFLVQILRLEIGPAGFQYRNLSGSRDICFTEIRRAYLEITRTRHALHGVATFWVEQNDGMRVKVNLRTFPLEAAAVLFTALEAHGIQIEVPDEWAARRMAEQVRVAQAKLPN